MIAGLEGILRTLGDDWAVVDVHGVHFRLQAPTSTLAALGATGDRVRLHTHLLAREDSLALYGFATAEEMRMFELLITVSGVGPKVALALLSSLNPERLAQAIATGDEDLLSSVSGVGKKTAARLALELKGKFEQVGTLAPHPHEDVKAALMGLGYSAAEAASASASVPDSPDLTVEDKVMLALKSFARSR